MNPPYYQYLFWHNSVHHIARCKVTHNFSNLFPKTAHSRVQTNTYEGNSEVKLIKWQKQKEIIRINTDIPFLASFNSILLHNNIFLKLLFSTYSSQNTNYICIDNKTPLDNCISGSIQTWYKPQLIINYNNQKWSKN